MEYSNTTKMHSHSQKHWAVVFVALIWRDFIACRRYRNDSGYSLTDERRKPMHCKYSKIKSIINQGRRLWNISYKVLPWFDLWGVQFLIYQSKIPTWSKKLSKWSFRGWFVENNRVPRWEKCFIFKHLAWGKVDYSVKKTLDC